jgi:hypothetical protein
MAKSNNCKENVSPLHCSTLFHSCHITDMFCQWECRCVPLSGTDEVSELHPFVSFLGGGFALSSSLSSRSSPCMHSFLASYYGTATCSGPSRFSQVDSPNLPFLMLISPKNREPLRICRSHILVSVFFFFACFNFF